MADLHHIWDSDLGFFIAANTIEQQFDWVVGEEQHYWGFSVRPFQANSDMQVVRQWTTTDNNLTSTQHFHLTTNSGGLFRFSAIWVVGA